jgi:hypothetical protein
VSARRKITHQGLSEDFIRQRNWTDEQLRAMGYEFFDRKKEVTLARQLPKREAPKTIVTSQGDKLTAMAGYMICYDPGEERRARIDDYEQWPVAPTIFQQTYSVWDEEDWTPNPAEAHLMEYGCKPYYKSGGVWAKKLEEDVYLQSLEHVKPLKIRTGQYVAIGAEGEPYSMGEMTFHQRYKPQRKTIVAIIKRLLRIK